MANDDVAAMVVVHMDDIKIAATATKEITHSEVAGLSKRFPTKHLGEVTCYMGSKYKRDREKGTLKGTLAIVQTQIVQTVVERFVITKTIPIPESPSLDLRHMSDEETTVANANFRAIVGSLT